VGKNFSVLDIFLWDIYRDTPPQFVFKQAHSRVLNINFKYLKNYCGGGGLYEYPITNISRTAKFLTTFG
jgi:hypothetical protein